MTMRYRLARSLTKLQIVDGCVLGLLKVVWLLLNPSTADAFKPDPTVGECIKRSTALGVDVVEIVNLFAFRSTYPTDLPKRAIGERGDTVLNNEQILLACTGASKVIAGWGNDGALGDRAHHVRQLLRDHDVVLHHLGTTKDGYPKHPLARGRHRIPGDLMPTEWEEQASG